MARIESVELPYCDLDVNEFFKYEKYAIPEHEPIKLSNDNYLHTYRITSYESLTSDPFGDFDDEE